MAAQITELLHDESWKVRRAAVKASVQHKTLGVQINPNPTHLELKLTIIPPHPSPITVYRRLFVGCSLK